MDLLNELPVRSEAIGDYSGCNKRELISLVDDDDGEERYTQKKKAKTTIDDGQFKLGLNLQDDYFEVPEIQKRRLPREDGLDWSFNEQTQQEESKRPYGKKYLADQADRQRDLSHNKDYRFMNELAGALRKELSDIVDPEDLARISRDREEERLQTEIELKRTRINMDKKYDLIQKLKQMAADEEVIYRKLREQPVPYYLTQLSRYLVDNKALVKGTANSQYGFRDLVNLSQTYSTDEKQRLRQSATLVNEVLEGEEVEELAKLGREGEQLFFYLYVYYRDFLDNETDYSLTDSIRRKITYALDHVSELTSQDSLKPSIVKQEEEASIPSATSTNDAYEQQLRQVLTTLPVADPLKLLNEFEEAAVSSKNTVDWSLYKQRLTETINMTYFDLMGISKQKEREMAAMGLSLSAYKQEAPEYVRQVIPFLYGTQAERLKATEGDSGLNILSGSMTDAGGNPEQIDALIRIQYPEYDTKIGISPDSDGGDRDIETLLRSHFLALFFHEVPWPQIVTLLLPEQASIVANIRQTTSPLNTILDSSLSFYKALLLYYLRKVAAALYTPQPPLITLPPNAEAILLGDKTLPSGLGVAALLFDELNRALKDINVRDIVNDDLFYEYLATGNNVFLKHRFDDSRMGNITSESGRGSTTLKAKDISVDEEYPALVLHDLLRAYNEYRTEYLLLSSENLARIKAAIDKGNRKIAEVVGDESYSLNRNTDYRQRKSFTAKPENSGFIKLRSEIKYLLDRGYHHVMQYAPNLTGLPLDAFQSDSAYESGLSIDFIDVIATLAASREYTFPDGYRTQQQYKKIQYDKQDVMRRMRQYTYTYSKCRGYTVQKDLNTTPFYATRVYAVPDCNTRRCYRPTRIMF